MLAVSISEYSSRRPNGDHLFNCGDLFRLILLIQTHLTNLCRIMQPVRNAAPPQSSRKCPLCWCADQKQPLTSEKDTFEFSVCRVNLKLLWGSEQSVGSWPADSASGKIKWKTRHLFLHCCMIINDGLTCTAGARLVLPKYGNNGFGFTWAEFLRKFVRSFN